MWIFSVLAPETGPVHDPDRFTHPVAPGGRVSGVGGAARSVSTRGHCSGKRKSYTKYTRHDSVGVKVFRITVTLKAYKCIKSDLDI